MIYDGSWFVCWNKELGNELQAAESTICPANGVVFQVFFFFRGTFQKITRSKDEVYVGKQKRATSVTSRGQP